MCRNPAVSIVVPVCNSEKYLPQTMRSICDQTLRDMEIICVDDCSTDKSPEILRNFASDDPRIRIFTHRQNLGEALARKRGMGESRGEFLMFVDSDDLLCPDCAERALELIRKNQCDILQFNARIMDGETVSGPSPAYTPYRGRIERSPLIEPWLVKLKFTHTLWGKIYRGDICRMAAEQMKDTPFGCTLEDYYIFFIITYFSKSYVGVPEESLCIYRRGVGINQNVLLTLRSVRLLPAFKEFLTARNALAENDFLLKCVAARLYDCSLSILLKTEKLIPEMLEEAVRCWGPKILIDFIGRLGVFKVRTRQRDQIILRLAKAVLQQNAARNT